MSKHIFTFIATFAIGALAALAGRAALHQPYADAGTPAVAPEYAPMVTNPAAPAEDPHAHHRANPAPQGPSAPAPKSAPAESLPATSPDAPAPAHDHAGHGVSTSVGETVNSVCAVCGMDVDPTVAPATYRGKLVGFGCRMCPPKFAADPDRYGPAALENRVVSN